MVAFKFAVATASTRARLTTGVALWALETVARDFVGLSLGCGVRASTSGVAVVIS